MSSLSDFFRIKLYPSLEVPISEKHGLTEYAIKDYIDDSIANISGSGEATVTEVTYDAITVARSGDAYPITDVRGSQMAQRQGQYVWDYWDSCYSKCKVKLTVGGALWSGGDVFVDGPFDTKTALYTWINSKIPNNGSVVIGHARIEVYDELGDVPALQKIYGYNNLYCGFAGGGNSKKSKTKTAIHGGHWVWDMFTELTRYFAEDCGLLTATISGSVIQAENENNKKLFWLPSGKKNLYGLPKVGSLLTLNPSIPPDFRKWWNETTGVSVNQTEADGTGHDIVGSVLLVMERTAQTWKVLNNIDKGIDWWGGSDQHIAIVYLVKNTLQDGRFAFFVKPVGISDVLVDWFDQSKYRLEAIGFNKDRQMRLKPISTTQDELGGDFFGDRTLVKKSQWSFRDSMSSMSNAGFVMPRSVKFRLRRLSDNKVGPLTSATVKVIIKTTGAKLKWIVC